MDEQKATTATTVMPPAASGAPSNDTPLCNHHAGQFRRAPTLQAIGRMKVVTDVLQVGIWIYF
jgi:hypothetical protein